MKITRKQRFRGFTLIELLVVILILAVLAALIVPRLITRAGEAKRAKAASDIKVLESALSSFRLDTDRYPTQEEGLQALVTEPNDVKHWQGPYIEKGLPPDPWGNAYIYEYQDDSHVTVISYGKDGVQGGDGENADVNTSDEGSGS